MSTIILSKNEYRRLKKKAAAYEVAIKIPTYYLRSRAGARLDRRVEKSLRDYRSGKTTKIRSLAELK